MKKFPILLLLTACWSLAAAQEQDREFFHRIFLLILFRLHVGQKYKKYAESGEPRCKVGA